MSDDAPKGFFQNLFDAGTATIRENFARRLGRAWANGFVAGQSFELRSADARARGIDPPEQPPNPHVDEQGQPRRDPSGMPVTGES